MSDIAPKLSKIENDINHITQEIEDLVKLKVCYSLSNSTKQSLIVEKKFF